MASALGLCLLVLPFWAFGGSLPVLAAGAFLMERTLRDRLLGISSTRSRLYRRRLLAVTSRILGGATFAEACRASGIPRGSQGRYRKSLQEFLETGISATRALQAAPMRTVLRERPTG